MPPRASSDEETQNGNEVEGVDKLVGDDLVLDVVDGDDYEETDREEMEEGGKKSWRGQGS